MPVFLLQDDLKACPGTEILCPTLLKYLKSGKSLKRLRRILIDEHRLEPDTMIVKSTSCQLVVVGGDKYTACLACQDLRNVVNQSGGGEKNEGILFIILFLGLFILLIVRIVFLNLAIRLANKTIIFGSQGSLTQAGH